MRLIKQMQLIRPYNRTSINHHNIRDEIEIYIWIIVTLFVIYGGDVWIII